MPKGLTLLHCLLWSAVLTATPAARAPVVLHLTSSSIRAPVRFCRHLRDGAVHLGKPGVSARPAARL